MPGVYVYGISAQPIRPGSRGVFGRRIRSIAMGPLHAIVESASRPPRPTTRNLTRQSRAIAALVSSGADVLPARFGTFMSDRAELRSLVEARRLELTRALRLIKGRVQMTVRVRIDTREPGSRSRARTPGASYLEAKAQRAHQRLQNPLVQAIQRAAKPYARDRRVEWREGPPLTASVHHLVLRNRVDQYEEAVGRAVWRRGARAVISGPWAPFAFAEVA